MTQFITAVADSIERLTGTAPARGTARALLIVTVGLGLAVQRFADGTITRGELDTHVARALEAQREQDAHYAKFW